MPLVSILSVEIRQDANARYEEAVRRLAQRAAEKKEKSHWTAHQVAMGGTNSFHFVTQAESFAEIETRGPLPSMLARVLGEKEAARFMEEVGACSVSRRQTVSVDRPDLSYVRGERQAGATPYAVVTEARVRPGGREAFEELLRKLAEAIAKVDDPAEVVAHQYLIGDLQAFWTVRPLAALADLDRMRPPDALLTEAFGASEGGLVFRAGTEAISEIRREIVAYRPELSHPSA